MSNWLTEKYIAHRGLFDNIDIPENSLKACKNAVDNNYPMEFDVQMTKDEVLVVFHDDTVDRMTKTKGRVDSFTYDELKQLTLLDTQETIPTLKEWLDTVSGQVPLLMEFKSHKNVGNMEQKVLNLLSEYKGDIALESFDPFIVRWLRINAPQYTTGLLACDHYSDKMNKIVEWMLATLKFRKYCKAQFIAYDVTATKLLTKFQKLRNKMPVIVYTVKSQEQHDNNKHLYDNMIFDSYIPRR